MFIRFIFLDSWLEDMRNIIWKVTSVLDEKNCECAKILYRLFRFQYVICGIYIGVSWGQNYINLKLENPKLCYLLFGSYGRGMNSDEKLLNHVT